jgi:hypothetical protein
LTTKAFSLINNLMSFEQIKMLSPELFKRYCGVKPDTFAKVCEFVGNELKRVRKKTGRPCKLSVEDQVLLTLEYWREYPTQFHIAKRWQLSEATVSRTIVKIENLLKNCRDFQLPGKKVLRSAENTFELIIIDVTESPIERPKKNNAVTIPGKRSGIR